MTREYLLRLIYMSDYCPDNFECQSTTLEQCQECCNKALTEYENRIYNKALDDFTNDVFKIMNIYLDNMDIIYIRDKLKKGTEND